ncbi:BglG family transcription antiterminator [Streptococcus pantholopis]|uniref:Phosphotransferase n=1 Tax=Streptococcus pantholopis TaxID=1811193 RepID=A0A172Q7J5_9STRE|nr:HTH domain-containing protein [Streptococcus pantholopis]AND79426.1 phosphotransferase [Streptococcus pantholopis]
MLLTKREEQLLKAFQDFGKLSINNISDILKVSRRTVYRTLADLTESLNQMDIGIIKEGNHYLLTGELENLGEFTSQTVFSRNERLNLIAFKLLTAEAEVTNEELQETFAVSNVTIIQDISDIEKRFSDFDLQLIRRKGYSIDPNSTTLRRVLAVLMTNNIPVSDFWQYDYSSFKADNEDYLKRATLIFQAHQSILPDIDAKMSQFFIILLALTGYGAIPESVSPVVSKVSLDFAKSVYAELSEKNGLFYPIQEILYYAAVLDELVIKRQETPLFHENFDSEFFYNVSNLIDKVALYTKINFAKDRTLFKFLFNHIRLSLAIPIIFEDSANATIRHSALNHSEYLHRVVTLLVREIFPVYLQSETEYELITLHFASSLRRSPDIYPITILLLSDERPLTCELLITRLKTIAPFVETVKVKAMSSFTEQDRKNYDSILSTQLTSLQDVKMISVYPDGKELLQLQEYLQDVQAKRDVKIPQDIDLKPSYNFQNYLTASQALLSEFSFKQIDNLPQFSETVRMIVKELVHVTDKDYLAKKLLKHFEISPLAIPETHLALLHTYSSKIERSCFLVFELKQPVKALSMNHQEEEISRILVMLTRLHESAEVRDLMTAISQSIIENHLYTEIYKTGNKDIIYQLLNQIFTEKIKKLEN